MKGRMGGWMQRMNGRWKDEWVEGWIDKRKRRWKMKSGWVEDTNGKMGRWLADELMDGR